MTETEPYKIKCIIGTDEFWETAPPDGPGLPADTVYNGTHYTPTGLFQLMAKRLDIWLDSGGVGRFEVLMDDGQDLSDLLMSWENQNVVRKCSLGHIYNDSVTHNDVAVEVMGAQIDDIVQLVNDESSVFGKLCKISGRNMGRILTDCLVNKNYPRQAVSDIMSDALTVQDMLTFVDSYTGDMPDCEYNFDVAYLQNGFIDILKETSCDYRVYMDGSTPTLELFNTLNPPANTSLKTATFAAATSLYCLEDDTTNNILKIDPRASSGIDIRNYVIVRGGTLKGQWDNGMATEPDGTPIWSKVNVNDTITNENPTEPLAPTFTALKLTASSSGDHRMYLDFTNGLFNHDSLDFSKKPEPNCEVFLWRISTDAELQMYAIDTDGNEIRWAVSTTTIDKYNQASNIWMPVKFGLGDKVVLGTPGSTWDKWFFIAPATTFNWNIVKFGFRLQATSTSMYVSGLTIPSVNVWAWNQDTLSQGAYSKSDLPLNAKNALNQLQLQAKADMELAMRRYPVEKLKLTCTYQPTIIYGDKVNVKIERSSVIPNDGDGEDFRVLSVHHVLQPGTDLCKGFDKITELELVKVDTTVDPNRARLVSAPQAAINVRFQQRLDVLERS